MPLPRLLPLAAVMAAACATSVHAQSLLTLYEAARDYDATYQGARAQYDASLARAAQAKAGVLPQVGLQGNVSRTNLDIDVISGAPPSSGPRDYTTQTVGVNATQPLYRPAAWAAYEQGKRQAEIAETVLMTAEQDLIVRVSQGYFDVLGAQDTLRLVRAQKAAVAEQLAFAKRNFEVGTSTITDSREAQARYDLVVAQEIAAENDLQVKRLALDQLVGRTGSAPLPLATAATLPAPSPTDMNAWVAQAEAVHPAIRQARLGLDVAGLEVQKAEAGHKPTLDAQVGYNLTRYPQGTATTTVGTYARAHTHPATLISRGWARPVLRARRRTMPLHARASATRLRRWPALPPPCVRRHRGSRPRNRGPTAPSPRAAPHRRPATARHAPPAPSSAHATRHRPRPRVPRPRRS